MIWPILKIPFIHCIYSIYNELDTHHDFRIQHTNLCHNHMETGETLLKNHKAQPSPTFTQIELLRNGGAIEDPFLPPCLYVLSRNQSTNNIVKETDLFHLIGLLEVYWTKQSLNSMNRDIVTLENSSSFLYQKCASEELTAANSGADVETILSTSKKELIFVMHF